MLQEIESQVKHIPAPWPFQPALFPGQADPWAVLWAARPPEANFEGIVHGYRELALCIFWQAVQDAQIPGWEGREAREWLAENGLELLTLMGVGVQPGQYQRWVKDGCTIPPHSRHFLGMY